MKTHSKTLPVLAIASAILLSVSTSHAAVVIQSFESGNLSGWGAGTLNGSTTTVTTDRATDGTHSAANSFTVAAGFSGWTMNTIIEIDPRTIMDASTTTLSVDVYSNWSNPNGWGVYGNSITLILNNSNGWTTVGPSSGSLANGSFQTLTWDMTPIAAAITDPGLAWSSIGIAWFVGTWAGDGGGGVYTDNGTQTFGIDKISITSVPEPSAAAALGALGVLAFLRRRRF